MRTIQRGDHQFFATVLDFRAAENDAAALRGPLGAAQSRIHAARVRVISQRCKTLRGVLWRLLRLEQDLIFTEAHEFELQAIRAAMRDLKAILRH